MDVHAETIQSNSVYFMGIASSGKLMNMQWVVDAETGKLGSIEAVRFPSREYAPVRPLRKV